MDEFYGMDISEEEQTKIMKIKNAIPYNIRGFIQTKDIQTLLKTNIEELDTQITILFSQFDLNASTQTREAIKKIIYPEQTTKINNNNITTTSINERKYIDQIKNILFNAKIEVDDNTASNLLEADEDTRRAVLESIFDDKNIKLNKDRLQKILKDITNIANNYQLSLVKNLLKPETGSLVQDYISDEKYATNPEIVKLVSDKFKEIFNCQTGLSEQNVKDLLMIKYRQRNSVLSTIIEQKKLKPILFGRDKFKMNELSFLLFICKLVSDFNKGKNNNKDNTQRDIIFSDQAVKRITDYFVGEYKNNKLIIDFTNAVIFDENEKIDQEILDNTTSRFSLEQINYMLRKGVSPDCLLAIDHFDIYIKYQYLANDILLEGGCNCLCKQFIDFLYMYIDKGCSHKTDANNELTPIFTQNLIIKYIKDKNLKNLEQIKNDPVIYSLFFRNDGKLRDKKEINQLLGTDEEIFDMFVNAEINDGLLLNILNINGISWEFGDNWLSKIKNSRYCDVINFAISQKKLKTLKLIDLLDGKNKNLNNLLNEKDVKADGQSFCLNSKQIAQIKAIKVIAQDLKMIESYLNPDDNKNKACLNGKNEACLKALQKIFNHQFWFDNLAETDFFTQLVTFLKKEILADFTKDGNINDIGSVNDLKKILQNKTLVYLFQNIESDFVMSVLLNQLLGNYLQIGNWTAQEYANVFIAFFESIKDNKNFSLGQFKNVFIKAFVAKTKNMNCLGMFAKGTVLQFVFNEINSINSLLQEEYKFEDTSYFDVCLGKLNIDPNDLSEEEDINANVIHDPDQENMDNLVFDFLRGNFNMHEEIKNEIVEDNKNENENQFNNKEKYIKQEDISQKRVNEIQTNKNEIFDPNTIVRKLPGISEELLKPETKIGENIAEVKNTDDQKNNKNENKNQVNSNEKDIKQENVSQNSSDETQANKNEFFDPNKVVRKLPGINPKLLNSEIKTDNKKDNKNANENNINDKDNNLIQNGRQNENIEIGQEIKRNDLDNKKGNDNKGDIRKINLNENDNNREEEKSDENNINDDKEKNLIQNGRQDENIEIGQEIKRNDLDNKKEENDVMNINDSNAQTFIEYEKSVENPENNQKEDDVENDMSKSTIKLNDDSQINIRTSDKSTKENEIMTAPFKTTNDFAHIEKGTINKPTIKIDLFHNHNIENKHTKYMSILYGLNTEIINEIDVAISNLRFTQNFNFLLPLNQIFNKYGKQKEEQIKQYYMDRFFDSNIFKTHMQEETFESMFRRYFTEMFLSRARESVFNNDDINYFWGQWKKTVLLHFDSQQFKNQKLNVNQNFCFETNYSPSKSHNISLELVNKISSSIENLEYYKPEDFFRGYHMLFEQENKTLINKDNKLGIQKYYIESFLMHYIQEGNIDTKFLRHVDFRFRGYLLKKQTIFNDEAVKYFYELLEKLLLGNKENEIVKNEVSDEINGHRIKNFKVNIATDFIEKQEAEKNCRNYKIAFWVLIVLAVLSGGAIYFSAYFAIPLVIAFGCSIFCFIKKGNYDRKISDLVGSEKCLLPEHQIESYKNSVKDNVICDIDYFAEIQEDEKNMYNCILDNRNNYRFGFVQNCKDQTENEKE